jgi:hypothetical protein
LNEYKEGTQWKQYPDELEKLKSEFVSHQWDDIIYTKTFEAINSINSADDAYPRFMKTPAWGKKNLITSLSAWTQLKHDMLLYSEQPMAAQAGQGGGPPPPKRVHYVEPNVPFWEKALELLEMQQNTLSKFGLMDERIEHTGKELVRIGEMLLSVSRKELAKEEITAEEFDKLSWIGGDIEYLTFKIFDTDRLPEQERLVAEVADVYSYNGTYLEEGVGMVDEIYVVTEINGKPYLTKGAVFSYYEFVNKSPLNDEEWRERVGKGNAPARPSWMKEIVIKSTALESKKEYSF